jgi:hypothetical protein
MVTLVRSPTFSFLTSLCSTIVRQVIKYVAMATQCYNNWRSSTISIDLKAYFQTLEVGNLAWFEGFGPKPKVQAPRFSFKFFF